MKINKQLFALALAVSCSAAANVHADKQSQMYLAISGGGSFISLRSGNRSGDTKIKPVVGAAIGYKFSNNLRMELDGTFRFKDGDSSIWTAQLSALYDFSTNSSIKPYAGLGIGVIGVTTSTNRTTSTITSTSISVTRSTDTQTGAIAAASASLGARISLGKSIDATLGYRFANVLGTKGSSYAHLHQVTAGLMFWL